MAESLPRKSRTRTPEEKAARRSHARVTVWREIHQAHLDRSHVVVQWWDRSHNGHITEIDDDGFRVSHPEDGGLWCSWEGATEVKEPWWDPMADNHYTGACRYCVEAQRLRSAS